MLLDFASAAYNPADQSGPHSADVFWYKVVRRDTYCIVLETYWESVQETTNQLTSCANVLMTRYSLTIHIIIIFFAFRWRILLKLGETLKLQIWTKENQWKLNQHLKERRVTKPIEIMSDQESRQNQRLKITVSIIVDSLMISCWCETKTQPTPTPTKPNDNKDGKGLPNDLTTPGRMCFCWLHHPALPGDFL